MMINYLTHQQFAGYKDNVMPSRQGAGMTGGGVATKTDRVVEALSEVFPMVSVVHRVQDVDANLILIDPIIISLDRENRWEVIEFLEQSKAWKILYTSEKSLMRLPHSDTKRIVNAVHAVTVNCEFQRNYFRYMNLDTRLHLLCDPVPSDFAFPKDCKKEMEVVAMGQISWFKNTMELIEIFEKLKGILPRKYIGSSSLWTNLKVDPHQEMLQRQLYRNADIVIEEGNRQMVASELHKSRFGVWVAYHDSFCLSLHEMLYAGVLPVTARHGLYPEMPVAAVAKGADAKVAAIKRYMKMPAETMDEMGRRNSEWVRERCSYDTFRNQLNDITRAISK